MPDFSCETVWAIRLDSEERSGESRGRPGRSYLIIRLKYRTEYRQLIYKSKGQGWSRKQDDGVTKK
jgi:hypothetical protein